MENNKKNQRRGIKKYLPLFLVVFISTLIITSLVVFLVLKIQPGKKNNDIYIPDEESNTETIGESETGESSETTPSSETTAPETAPPETQPAAVSETVHVQVSSGNGSLILANDTHVYNIAGDANIVKVYDFKNKCFSLANTSVILRRDAVDYFNSLSSDFANSTQNTSLLIKDGFLTNEQQGQYYAKCVQIYGLGKVAAYAQQGGCSDCNTGYSFTISSYVQGVGASNNIFNNPTFQWVKDNMHKYGFIQRYPTAKKDITFGFADENCVRFVGIPHAFLMRSNSWCLEEYIEELKKHDIGGEHLSFTDDTGITWEVFSYVISDHPDGVDLVHNAGGMYSISDTNDGIAVVAFQK